MKIEQTRGSTGWTADQVKQAQEMHRKSQVLFSAGSRMRSVNNFAMADMYEGKAIVLLHRATQMMKKSRTKQEMDNGSN